MSISIGSLGRHFYMLLKGSVYILANCDLNRIDYKERMQMEKKNSPQRETKETQNIDLQNIEENNQGEEENDAVSDIIDESPSLRKDSAVGSPYNTSINSSPLNRSGKRKGTNQKNLSFKLSLMQMQPNEPQIMSEQQVILDYPDHTLLATLHAPNYFGEIALNTQTLRYTHNVRF